MSQLNLNQHLKTYMIKKINEKTLNKQGKESRQYGSQNIC